MYAREPASFRMDAGQATSAAAMPNESRFACYQKGCQCDARMHVQAQEASLQERHEAAVQRICAENEAIVDEFLRTLQRPMTPAERHVFLRAQAGLDVPPDNPLGLTPHSAADAVMCASR